MQNSVNHRERGRAKRTEKDREREATKSSRKREERREQACPVPQHPLSSFPPSHLSSPPVTPPDTHAHARTRTHAWQTPACLLPVTAAVRAQDESGEADERVATRRCGKEGAGRSPAHPHSCALGELSPLMIRKPSKLKPPSLRCPQCQSSATTSAAPAGSAAHQ